MLSSSVDRRHHKQPVCTGQGEAQHQSHQEVLSVSSCQSNGSELMPPCPSSPCQRAQTWRPIVQKEHESRRDTHARSTDTHTNTSCHPVASSSRALHNPGVLGLPALQSHGGNRLGCRRTNSLSERKNMFFRFLALLHGLVFDPFLLVLFCFLLPLVALSLSLSLSLSCV